MKTAFKNFSKIFYILFFLNFFPSSLFADYKLGVFLEEFCFENGYGFAFKKKRPSNACKPYGLAVNKFANNSFGKEIGLQQLDIIVKFDGKVTKTMDDFMKQFSSTKNKVNHQMTIHRWNRSEGKIESYEYKFKVLENEIKNNTKTNSIATNNNKSNQNDSKKTQIKENKNDECSILDKPDISKDYLVEKSVRQKNNINYFYFWVNNKRVLINKSDRSLKFSNGNLFVPNYSKTFPYTCKHDGQKKQLEILVNGHGVIQFDNGDTYKGTINQKLLPEGEGEISYSNGSSYKGQIKNLKPDGTGLLNDKYTIYEGSFKDGVKDGIGTLIVKQDSELLGINNFSFTSSWKNGEIDPVSLPLKIEFEEGLYFIGNLNEKYLPHGHGNLFFNENTYLRSEWVNGIIGPETKLYIHNYEADVKVNSFSYRRSDLINQIIISELIFKNKNKYIGEYNLLLGIESGFIIQGNGSIYSPDGKVLQKGKFKSNKLIEGYDNGEFIFDNGNIYIGEIDNFLPNGFGRVFDNQNNLKSNGIFINGKKSGLFVENKTNQLQLVNYISDNSIQNMGNTKFEICDPKINIKNNCNAITSIKFVDELEGQFIGSFKENQPFKGSIFFKSNDVEYFDGVIYQDEFKGSLYKTNGEVYEGSWKVNEDFNTVFIGSKFDEFKNETIFTLNKDSSIDERFISNYSITNDGNLILRHDLIVPTSKVCNQKFYEPNTYNKEFNILDFHDLYELKKKKEYYNNLLTDLQKYSKDNVFDWDASLKINPIINGCYFNSYEQIKIKNSLENNTITTEIPANTKFKIKFIARDYLLLENDSLIKRFNDQLSTLEKKFTNIPKKYKDSNNSILEAYAPILLDYAYSLYPNEIINYKNDLNIKTNISERMVRISQNISYLDKDKSIDKDTKKKQTKIFKKEIKLLKNELKELNKKMKKEYTWNNFENLTSKLSSKNKEIYDFVYLNLYPNGKDNIFVQIQKWQKQFDNYIDREQAAFEEKQKKIKEKRKQEELKKAWEKHYRWCLLEVLPYCAPYSTDIACSTCRKDVNDALLYGPIN